MNPQIQPHATHTLRKFVTDPLFLIFVILYGLALSGVAVAAPEEWYRTLFLAAGVIAVSAVILYISRGYQPSPVKCVRPQPELRAAVIWFLCVFILAVLTDARGLEAVNGFTNWILLFCVPLVLLHSTRRHESLSETCKSVGLHRHGLPTAVKIALFSALLFLPFILLSVNPQQRIEILDVFRTPRVLIAFPLSFLLALVLAGFTEEFFFRGILQSRIAAATGSELQGLLAASLLFGVLHLPHAYLLPTWPTYGNAVWSLASVMTEYAITGVLLGVLWVKTHNLAAPVLVHGVVNALVLMTSVI